MFANTKVERMEPEAMMVSITVSGTRFQVSNRYDIPLYWLVNRDPLQELVIFPIELDRMSSPKKNPSNRGEMITFQVLGSSKALRNWSFRCNAHDHAVARLSASILALGTGNPTNRCLTWTKIDSSKMMLWKRVPAFKNMAILGIYVEFLGCKSYSNHKFHTPKTLLEYNPGIQMKRVPS